MPWLVRGLRRIRPTIKEKPVRSVFVMRLIPGFLQFPALLGGMLHVKYGPFALGVAAAGVTYDYGLVIYGYIANIAAGASSQDLKDFYVIGFIVLLIISWVVLFFRYRHP